MNNPYRSDKCQGKVIAFGISFERDNLLARGLGLEHLRELLLRLARPILRAEASLAYGGHWNQTEDNFTYDLVQLIRAEQEDKSASVSQQESQEQKKHTDAGILYNHSAWPQYLDITPAIEAQWVNCCRVIRVTQQMAGIGLADIVADEDAQSGSLRTRFNAAVSLSAMRRLMMDKQMIEIPDTLEKDEIPAVEARILLGGRVRGYWGFLPGLFEEALVSMKHGKSLFILGGFGGAAEVLARVIVSDKVPKEVSDEELEKLFPELTIDWQKRNTPNLAALMEKSKDFTRPTQLQTPDQSLHDLRDLLLRARVEPQVALKTGLDKVETRQLLTTSDPHIAVKLIRQGLENLGLLEKRAE